MPRTSVKAAPPNGGVLLIGAGRMGVALAKGWCADGLARGLTIIEPNPGAALKALAKTHRLALNPKPEVLARLKPSAVVLAVKPQLMETVAPTAAPFAAKGALVVSIAAGTSLKTLARLTRGRAIVRAMPNLPAAIGKGVTVAAATAKITKPQRALAARLLGAAGEFHWCAREALIDPVTAVSGSGPAYVFLLAECLEEAGVAEGLPRPLAAALAKATITGAGALLDATPESPKTLRDGVTSPGGTTAAALAVLLGKGGLEPLMKRAVKAATRRARQLGR